MVTLIVSFMSTWCPLHIDTRHMQLFGCYEFSLCSHFAMYYAQPQYGFASKPPTMTVTGVDLYRDVSSSAAWGSSA